MEKLICRRCGKTRFWESELYCNACFNCDYPLEEEMILE